MGTYQTFQPEGYRPEIYRMESGAETGSFNMAMDEALLEWVRLEARRPVLVVRTYQWCVPTLSVGVHQRERELPALFNLYSRGGKILVDGVRRPTGGRAILHGEDISFSFMTNIAAILRLPLKESYCFLTAFLKTALVELGVEIVDSCETREKAYTLSPICFETKTPSDLVDGAGRKIAGCAQLRRDGGILQHGAAFLAPYRVDLPAFSQALFRAVYIYAPDITGLPPQFPIEEPAFARILSDKIRLYKRSSGGSLARASTTSGSHLVPASF